jgi:hypothetical protein
VPTSTLVEEQAIGATKKAFPGGDLLIGGIFDPALKEKRQRPLHPNNDDQPAL